MEAGKLYRQYLVGAAANIAILCTGFSMGWTAPINIKLTSNDTSMSPLEQTPSTDEIAWMGSVLNFGAIIGPFIGGFAASTIGRKWGLMSSTIPLFVGWILVAAARNMAFLYAGRIFWGVAVGMLFTISPMYCAEIATIGDVFRGSNFKAFYISCALVFFQQFSGINAVLFYMTDIFKASGTDMEPSVATIIIGAVQLCVTPRFFPSISESIGMHVGFFIFCACCIAAFFFTLFVVPETKGKSFLEIQQMLGAK
ncbi:jg21347 [Pararge aegeria aegeria]|uniref:Jg21347 protein n=1 Tax=Pararge aegeria aegeria TaxID=348720 RepID=A0A8S4S0U5_9NEOP|nr:jg21347 [Pararge aegeria aegeria]